MRHFDATIKLLIQDSANEMLRQLGVGPVTEWLNVELPRVQNRRADLVGRTASGLMIHIELQSENDPEMPLRMADTHSSFCGDINSFPTNWCCL